jgi:hypothetical protein
MSSLTQNAFSSHSPQANVRTLSSLDALAVAQVRGVNTILWDDSDTRYKPVLFDWLQAYGIDYVMLNFGWNKLEPQKGVYNQSYLGEMDRFITKAKSAGIRIILRMHKYAYPNAYQAQQPGNIWILGYPAWINATPDFWENVDNCQANYVAMWTMLATRYKNEPYVVGFELFSEPGTDIGPGIYDPINASWQDWSSNTARKVMAVLFDKDKLYERTINAIHAITDKLVIIESFVGGSISYIKNANDTELTAAQKPNSENFAVGESVYEPYQFEWLDDNWLVAQAWNVPSIVTEFGVQVAVIDSPDAQEVAWVEEACGVFAARKMGWFYWELGPGPNGDYNLVNEADNSSSTILCYLGRDSPTKHPPLQYTSVSLNVLVASANPPTTLVSGMVYPNPCGPVNVTLEYSIDESASYQEIARITTSANGSFSYSWKPPAARTLIMADMQGLKSPSISVEISRVIPGYPLESFLLGVALGVLIAILGRKRHRIVLDVL